MPAAPAKAAGIYYFVDDLGVRHYTNRPGSDARFKLLFKTRSRPAPGTGVLAAPPPEISAHIHKYCQEYGFDDALVTALIEVESNFNASAVSSQGAQGLMQIMPETQKHLGLTAPFDPEANIEAGLRYLRELYDRYGDLDTALAAYNAGPGAVDAHGGVPPFSETRSYVDRIMERYRQLSSR